MGRQTIELQNELFMSLAQLGDAEVTPKLVADLDYLLDVMKSQVELAKRAADHLENRRRVFTAMRNEVAERLKKRVQQ